VVVAAVTAAASFPRCKALLRGAKKCTIPLALREEFSQNQKPSGEKLGHTYKGTGTDWCRTRRAYLLALVLSPLSCVWVVYPQSSIAQEPPASPSIPTNPPLDQLSANRVSAHELQIPQKAREAFNKGTELLAAKNPEASIPEFQRAIKIFSDFYEAYYKIGLADLNLKSYPEAQAAFETSIELSKGRYPPSQFGLGVALCMQKELTEAEEAVRAGLDQYPADAAGHFTLAWILYTANKLAEAEASARRALLYKADFPIAYLLLAQIHLGQNNLSEVASDLDAYLKLDPNGVHSAEAKAVRTQAARVLAQQPGNGPVVAKSAKPPDR
jgi:tetratricopeptide (TPR) repeat protein